MLRRWMAIILSVTMVFMLVPTSTYAETSTFSDMPDDWSTAALESAVDNGLLKGSNGKIMPQENLTRAQMATVINRAFGSYVTASLDGFTDVSREEWYYSEMAKAVAMGTFQGSGNNLDPNDPITREQAFAVIARALNLGSSTVAPAGFSDLSKTSTWATGEVYSLVNNGYIQGSNGKLNPQGYITRAEFAQVMDNIIKEYVRMPGEYTLDVVGNVMITMPGVTLSDSTITGDLIIGDGVFEGDATLDNVEVTGRLLVRGGGTDSISITGGSVIGSITVAKVNGAVRVYAEDGTEIGEVVVDGKDDVILEGIFADIAILSDDITVWATNATIDTLTVEGDDSNLVIGEGSTVEKLVLKGVGTEVEVSGIVAQILVEKSAEDTVITVDEDGEVEEIIVNSAGTLIKGEGKVEDIQANADNVVVETEGTKVTAGDDTEGVMAGDKEVDAGRSIVVGEEEEEPSSSGGGGSAGGGSTTPPKEDDDTTSPPDDENGEDQETEEGLTISGTVSLPNNEVAPEGGILVEMDVVRYGSSRSFVYLDVIIPEGENHVDYKVNVEAGTHRLCYNLDSKYDYITSGYYAEAGTTVNHNLGTKLLVESISLKNIDIEILKGYPLRGEISIIEGDYAPEGGILIGLSLDGEYNYQRAVTIPEGENSIEYYFRVLDGDYKLRVDNLQNDTYLNWAYYNEMGLVPNKYEAETITIVDDNNPNINMELGYGNIIQGTIHLPDGMVADQNLVLVVVSLEEYSELFLIREGDNSVDYSLRVLDGDYSLSVYSDHVDLYSGKLYYDGTNFSPDYNLLELITIPDENVTIYDIDLYKKISLESIYPYDGQQDYYPLYSYLNLVFSEEMRDLTSREIGRIELVSESGEVVPISEVAAGISDKTNMLIIVNDSLELDTNYTLNIPADTIKSVNEIPYKEQIEINFKTAHTVLKGKISFNNGISGSKLELVNGEGSVIEEKTLTDGGYRFVNLDGGEYTLKVTMDNGDIFTEEINVVGNSLNKIDISFSDTPISLEDDWEFQINNDDTITITGYLGNSTEVFIPAEINGMAVSSVEGYDYLGIESITFPESVEVIDQTVFYRGLIENINVDSNNSHYKSLDGVLFSKDMKLLEAYPMGNERTDYYIPDGVETIKFNAFATTIYNGELALKDIYIPESVKFIDDVHSFTARIRNIIVDNENMNYRSIDGVLFNKVGDVLIGYPNANERLEYSIPEGVKEIAYHAFYETGSIYQNLEVLNIPSSLELFQELFYLEKLQAIYVEPDNEYFTSIEGVLFSKDMKTLVSYPMGSSRITYSIPEGITKVEYGAFNTRYQYPNDALKSVTIPASLGDIGGLKLVKLESISVNDNNNTYKSVDGVLFSKDGKELIRYPGLKQDIQYSIPSFVEIVKYSAFFSNNHLVRIVIPNENMILEGDSISWCQELEDLIIYNNITIGNMGVMSRKDVTVWGYENSTAQQFADIEELTFKLLPTISVTPSAIILGTGETLSVEPTISNSEGIDVDIVWSTSDASIATVDSDGLIQAISTGEVVITATLSTDESIYSNCNVTVVPPGNNYTVTTNGGIEVVEADVALYEAESTLWVPLRFLAEAFNWEVYWDSIESTATLVDGSNSVEVSVDTGYLVINQDKSFCDLEYVSQALGYDLSWDLDLNSITLMKQ